MERINGMWNDIRKSELKGQEELEERERGVEKRGEWEEE
jgi:hypothetical protein